MILNEILIEKYRVQKQLSANSQDIHDYFKKMHASAQSVSQKYGIPLNYRAIPKTPR